MQEGDQRGLRICLEKTKLIVRPIISMRTHNALHSALVAVENDGKYTKDPTFPNLLAKEK